MKAKKRKRHKNKKMVPKMEIQRKKIIVQKKLSQRKHLQDVGVFKGGWMTIITLNRLGIPVHQAK